MSPRIKSSTRNYVLFIIMSVLAALEVASGFICGLFCRAAEVTWVGGVY